MNNPFERYAPLSEVEEPTWEFEYGITTSSVDTAREAIAKKVSPLLMLSGLCFLILLGRLMFLQIVRGETYRLAAQGNSIRTSEIAAPRGLIEDRLGNPIVKNVASFSLEVIPAYLPTEQGERSIVLQAVQERTGVGVDTGQIAAAGQTLEPLTLKEELPYEQALAWEIQLADLPGVAITKRPRREYQDLPGIAHLLGYIGKISREELDAAQARGDARYGYTSVVGKSGLEVMYETDLKGSDGKTQLEVDARGRKIRQLASIAPVPGNNLQLFLDPEVQQVLSTTLADSVGRVGSKAGAGVAIDPKTGGILALSSFPSFEPEVFSPGGDPQTVEKLLADPNHPLVNRPIAGVYPPGSTIKPLWAAAGLQEGTISTETTVLSVGGFNVGQFPFKDWKGGGHGLTDVKKGIAESVNTFFYAVAGGYGGIPGLGIERLKKYATLFGIGEPTGVDLPSEGKGFFPDPDWKRRTRGEGWFLGNTYQVGIGQGDVLVTPMELLMAETSIINGGELLRPQAVQKITNPAGEIVREFGKQVIRGNFIDPANLQIVKEGMRETITDGSARSLNDLPVEAGGKTGTAQFASNKKTHAWFFGFAPWQDPQIAILVLIEGGGEGTTAAVPVAKEVFRAYFTP